MLNHRTFTDISRVVNTLAFVVNTVIVLATEAGTVDSVTVGFLRAVIPRSWHVLAPHGGCLENNAKYLKYVLFPFLEKVRYNNLWKPDYLKVKRLKKKKFK